MSADDTLNARRDFLRKSLTLIPVVTLATTGGAGLALAEPERQHSDNKPGESPAADAYQPTFFTPEEWAFLQAAVARLIPADDRGPGALEAGVSEYIDRQMNTPYAQGANWYMQGPFQPDAPSEMGYQLRLNPQQVYRLGIKAADDWSRQQYGKTFAELDAETQDTTLKQFEAGKADFQALPSKTFFAALLQNTKEGFFCDPIHGGNKDMIGWKLVGFPGARADFMDWVERDVSYPFPPVSIRGERA
ncbi:gluconate 2-dehydrogenase gamma chain [Pseudomonas duriflava]|uniref:Gluconate 2-dehydrogenase gamma chain n=1 Tax=Pseudomonas duriflava TaxID=459528 RepID=A0A562QKY3_9PSED|nr:gluconate 2-dehydrogenase subunit 3 family protein [Pseudomonas duriflava]TWI57384.1 gluconate 2-dehydrogenase gamma chain [Pseudomonas duriflava]